LSNDTTANVIIVISAPSGTGKTTLINALLERSEKLKFSVSYTTRPPREGELNGKDYFFVSEKTFKEMIEQNEFVEWVENFGWFYGTARRYIEEVLKDGFDLLIDVETWGAKKIKEAYPEAGLVFILPPSWDELKTRVLRRGVRDEEEINRRFAKAKEEIKEILWYDYIIINDKFTEAFEQLWAVYQAEKLKLFRMTQKIEKIMESFQGGY